MLLVILPPPDEEMYSVVPSGRLGTAFFVSRICSWEQQHRGQPTVSNKLYHSAGGYSTQVGIQESSVHITICIAQLAGHILRM